MNKSDSNEITFMQFIFIIHGAQLGIGMFSLPKDLAVKAGTDGWISLIIGYCCSVISSIVIVKIMKRYPDDTLPDLLIRLFGKLVGKALIIPVIFYFAFFVWAVLSLTMLYIKHWFLPLTPDYIVMILLVLSGYIIASKSVRILGRYCELVFYLMIGMFFIFLLPARDSHWIHLLPVFKEGWIPILQGVPQVVFSFVGFELVFFLYPFLQKKHLAVRGVVIANTITLFVYLEVILICYAFFSPDGITHYNQPVFNLLKVIEFKYLERIDMIFLALYLFIVSSTWLSFSFGAIFSTGHLLGKKEPSPFTIVFFLLLVMLVFIIHPTWNDAHLWTSLASNAGMWFAYFFPFLLYLYVRLHNRFRRSGSK